MSSLADLLNTTWEFLNDRARKSGEAARAATGINDQDGVLDIARKTAKADIVPESQRIAGIMLPEFAASTASAPTTMYNLLNAGVSKATGGDFLSTLITGKSSGGWQLPGAEASAQITRDIRAPVSEMSDAIVGKKVEDKLLEGSLNDLVGAWTRLGLSAGASVPLAIPKVASGIKLLDETANAAARVAEAITPLTLSKNPTVGLIGTNVAVGGALGAGIEHAIGSNFPKTAQVPTGQDPTQVAGQQAPAPAVNPVIEAKAQADEFAKGAQDAAAAGIAEAKATPSPVQAGFSTGSTTGDATLLGAGLGAAAIYSYWKRGVAFRAITGLEKGETTHQTPSTVAAEMLGDRNAPIAAVEKERLGVPNSGIGTDYREAGNAVRGNGLTNEQARLKANEFESKLAERTGASIETKVNNQLLQFGEFPDSAIRITPYNERMLAVKSLDPQQQAAIDRLLNIRHELDTRQLLAREQFGGLFNGRIGTVRSDQTMRHLTQMGLLRDDKVAFNMYNEATKDLLREWDNRFTDRKVANLVDGFINDFRKGADYLFEQRLITQAERDAFDRVNPHYVATELSSGKSHLGERKPAPMSGLENPGSPMTEYPKYFTELVRAVESNKVHRDALLPLIAGKRANDPVANKYIGRITEGLRDSSNASHTAVTFKDHLGKPITAEILDPIYRRALKSVGNPSALTVMNSAMKVLTTPARFMESSATGVIGAATGSVFAPISAAYSAGVGAATRVKGLGAVGPIDKFIQSRTGGKFGLPGDPTALLAMFPHMATNVAAVVAQHGAYNLRNSLATSGFLSKVMSPATMQHFADSMEQFYKRSAVYDLQTRGQLGPASLAAVDPSKRIQDIGAVLNQHRTVWGRAVQQPQAYLRFVGDILHAISISPTTSVMALNKNMPKTLVSKQIREMAGDPSRAGAFNGPIGQAAKFVTAISPWGNIFLQGNRRILSSFKRDPIGTTMGVFNQATLPAIMATMYAASLGEEYADYQYFVRTPDRQAGYIYIPIPGLPPHMGLEIPVEPTLRAFKWGGEAIAAGYLGLLDGSYWKEGNEQLRQSLAEITNFRMFGASAGDTFSMEQKTVPNSIIGGVYMPPVNPLIGAGAAAAGVKLRGFGDAVPIAKNNNGFTEAQGRNPLRPWEGAETEAIISAIGTDSMRWLYNSLSDMYVGAKQGQPTGEMLGNFKDSYKQRVKDSAAARAMGSSALFENFQALSPGTEASAALVKQKLDGIKAFTEAYQKVTDKGVPLGNNVGNPRLGYQQSQGVGPVMPEDQRVLGLAFVLNRSYPDLSKSFLASTKSLYDERARISASVDLSPEKKRALMNAKALDIVETNRQLLQRLTLMENNLSQHYGMPIKFEKLKPGKKMEELR